MHVEIGPGIAEVTLVLGQISPVRSLWLREHGVLMVDDSLKPAEIGAAVERWVTAVRSSSGHHGTRTDPDDARNSGAAEGA